MWVGVSLILIAAFDLCQYIVLCTRFLHDIYAVFVCTIYITDGINGVVERFAEVEWDQAFFAFFLALFCLLFALGFYYLDRMSTYDIQSMLAAHIIRLRRANISCSVHLD